MERINISTRGREEFVDVTEKVEEGVAKSGIKNGIVYIFVPHTTCGLTINENADVSVRIDLINTLKKLVPEKANYQHQEGNSDAHLKSSMLGHSLSVFIENGRLALGTWQGIYLCEFDGPRNREIWLKVISG